MNFTQTACAALISAALLSGCNSSNSDTSDDNQAPTLSTKIGILTDTQGGGDNVAVNQMEAILDLYRDQGVDIVIAVGDLTNSNTEHEYEQWKALASQYTDQITFLPLMGNHDRKPGDNYTWKRIMEEFIPRENINHMPGREFQTYAYTRGNVLMVQISDQDMPYAYEWAEEAITGRGDNVEHVFVSTHSPFVGPYRGGVAMERVTARWNDQRENDMLTRDFPKWRSLFTKNDVMFVSGHDHQYSRSVIWDNGAGMDTMSGTQTNHRFFHHIVTGNASEKGYYNRVGEFEKLQSLVMYKTRYQSPRSIDRDNRPEWTDEMIERDMVATGDLMVNASWFDIQGDEINYSAFYDTFTDSADLLDSADWKLFDRFVRTNNRCDKVVFPTSVPFTGEYYSAVDSKYRTVNCYSNNGERARIIDGQNDVFNRVDQALDGANWMGWSDPEAIDRMWEYMIVKPTIRSAEDDEIGNPSGEHFVVDGRSGLNYNHAQRFVVNGSQRMHWYPATYDMKKLVSLNWTSGDTQTASDILIIDGLQSQTGTYINAFGAEKDITTEPGWPGTSVEDIEADGDHKNLNAISKQPLSYPELLAQKSPNRLDQANSWVLDDQVRADDYVFEIAVSTDQSADALTLAVLKEGEWQPLVESQCISTQAYRAEFMTSMPDDIGEECDNTWLVGQFGDTFWAKVDMDGRFALVNR
ncbi:metallophosphoesterase [Vibrio sp. WXL210]|uniref:metallophosphoesterase n=1 Tax=Vibrio sp. WXL210 TaxID=3450709 RepID=UPI003EC52A98